MVHVRFNARHAVAASVLAGLLAACGGDSTEADAPGEPSLLLETVVDEVTSADGVRLKLARVGTGAEDDSLALDIVTDNATGDIQAALTKVHGPLTLLELFQALAPGHTPPDVLVKSHPGEAAGLQRAEPALVKGAAVTPEVRAEATKLPCNSIEAAGDLRKDSVGAQPGQQYLCVGLGFGSGAGSRSGFGIPGRERCDRRFQQQIIVGYCQNSGPITSTYYAYGRSDRDTSRGADWSIGTVNTPVAGTGMVRRLLTIPGHLPRNATHRAAMMTTVPNAPRVSGALYTATR